MRILIVASESPPIVSGVARAVGEIADGLRRRGHTVRIISSADGRALRWDRLRLSSVGWRLRSVLSERESFDVVNIHGPAPSISDIALIRTLFVSSHPPVVYTHHFTLHFNVMGVDAVAAIYSAIVSRLTRRCSAVVTTTHRYAQMQRTLPGQGYVIPWGVDQPALAVDHRRYDANRRLRVLVVGQFRRYKGMAVAVEAVLGCPQLHLVLVGDGPTFESVRSKVSAEVTNVEFRGKVDDSELEDLYLQSDVILLPSRSRLEAFGIVLLEGMRYGCVPVASDLPGVDEVVGDVGLLVSAGDHLDLRAKLLQLASRPSDVEDFSARAITRAATFTWERTVDGYEELFARIAGNSLTDNLNLTHRSLYSSDRESTTNPDERTSLPTPDEREN